MSDRTAKEYSEIYLEVDRPKPLTDKKIEQLITEVLEGNIEKDISDQLYIDFQNNFKEWLSRSNLNQLTGFDSFYRSDICIGCTQFIDNLYMKGPIQVLKNDYRYHERLGLASIMDVGSLIPDIPLIVAMPFPGVGDPHPHMESILNECMEKNIPIHIDGAWITCSRAVSFNFDHPAVVSVGISLSKGLGLGWNRTAIRWTKSLEPDSISIMNDFHMNNRIPIMVANHFLKNLNPDHLWNTHENRYNKICKDFDLTPTNSIHIALRNGSPVGVSSLIRYLEDNELF